MSIIIGPLFAIIGVALNIYLWVVILSAVLSWLVAFNVINTRNQVVYTIGDVLYKLTDPALRRIRRVVPLFGGVDISPVILILAIEFVQMVLGRIAYQLYVSGY